MDRSASATPNNLCNIRRLIVFDLLILSCIGSSSSSSAREFNKGRDIEIHYEITSFRGMAYNLAIEDETNLPGLLFLLPLRLLSAVKVFRSSCVGVSLSMVKWALHLLFLIDFRKMRCFSVSAAADNKLFYPNKRWVCIFILSHCLNTNGEQ